MRYFLDCEFNGFGGAFISIGVAPEAADAAPFYEATSCENPTPWVRDAVLPALRTEPKPVADIACAFAAYLADDPDPLLVADWPEDIAHAAQLLTLGTRRLVVGTVRFELLEVSNFSTDVLSKVPHNAYEDALALREYMLAHESWLARAKG